MKFDMGVKIFYGIWVYGLFWSMMIALCSATIILRGANFTLTFQDIESNFAPGVLASGICGKLYTAEPLDACSPLINKVERGDDNCTSPFALIIRGVCNFDDKVKEAQAAGFEAVIIYDNLDGGILVPMSGKSTGIEIPAVYVLKSTGEKLKSYAGLDVQLWIFSSHNNSTLYIMVISFISLLGLFIVLAICFSFRRYRMRHEREQITVREFHGIGSRSVKAMPSIIFTTVTEDNCTSSACAICLEDYNVGDKLRILPCRHKFHAFCVDAWLTSWRSFCPVCKRDAMSKTIQPPPSESTPLLSSNLPFATSSPLSSFRSSSNHFSAIQIASPISRVPNSPQITHPLCSPVSLNQSSFDIRNMSQRSQASQYASPSSLSTRYMSSYIPSPTNASLNILGPSIRQTNPLHYSDSSSSCSPYASAHSLPGC